MVLAAQEKTLVSSAQRRLYLGTSSGQVAAQKMSIIPAFHERFIGIARQVDLTGITKGVQITINVRR